MKNNESSKLLQLVEIDNNRFAIEVVDGIVRANLTQMAKPFGQSKRPGNWLTTNAAKEYLAEFFAVANILATAEHQSITVPTKIGTADLVTVRKGGIPGNQGTWANHHNVIMEFARWLSPKFSIEVNELIFKLLIKQAIIAESFNGVWPVIYNNKAWYYYREVLRSIGYSITSGSVAKRKKDNPNEFVKLYGRNFISLAYCHKLKEDAMKLGIQLEINFTDIKQLEGGVL